MQAWPLGSHIELPALPSSARSARLHTTRALRRWQLESLVETAELVASELVTNAVRAATAHARQQRETGRAARAELLRFWLTSDRNSVLIQVWDSDHRTPARKDVGPEAEAGRGVLLIETLSAQWGWYTPDGESGKIVWAVCAQPPLVRVRCSSGDGPGTPATAAPGG